MQRIDMGITLEASIMKKDNRIEYIDIFRSLGIIIMIMGHIGFGKAFDYWIHAFHMPMFFWISGFLFKHKSKSELSFRALVFKKAKTLLLPYAVFGIAHYLLYVCINHKDIDISPLIHLVSVNTEGLPICGALWFLTALFFTDILFFILDRSVASEPLKAIIIALLSLAGNLNQIVFSFTLPFALGPALVSLGLYYIGHLCRKYAESKVVHRVFNLPWIPTILLGIITAILIFLNGYINMRAEIYAVIPLFWVNAVLAVIVGVNFSKLLHQYIRNGIVEKWLVSISTESIVYVCLNQVVISVVAKATQMVHMPVYLSSVFNLVITMALLWIMSKIIVNTKLKRLIGK